MCNKSGLICRGASLLLTTALLSFFASNASASSITFESTSVMVGGGKINSNDVLIGSSGTYEVTLTDYRRGAPVGINNLILNIVPQSGSLGGYKLVNGIFDTKSYTFDADPGLYHLQVSFPGVSKYALIGLGMQQVFSDIPNNNNSVPPAVPLPAPFFPMLSALPVVAMLARKKKRTCKSKIVN